MEEFHVAEINHTLKSDGPADMIFDCWTPARYRGLGHYAHAISLAAKDLQQQGKSAWIFCDAKNAASIRGLVKAGFAYRFSLVRRRTLGFWAVTREECSRYLSVKPV
jgi:predicted GNAT family acetyltransferase